MEKWNCKLLFLKSHSYDSRLELLSKTFITDSKFSLFIAFACNKKAIIYKNTNRFKVLLQHLRSGL